MGKKKITIFNIEGHRDFPSGISTQVDWEPRTNIIVSSAEALVELELPGVRREDIQIEMEGDNELVIKGIKNQPKMNCDNPSYFLFEREFGRFHKRLILDFPVAIDSISSQLKDGVLVVRMPRKKKARVNINVDDGGSNDR